jgi:hypothetical protein
MGEHARRYRAQINIFGHTHIPELSQEDGVLMFNPGSPSLPKAGVLTVGLLDTDTGGAELIDLPSGKVLQQVQFEQGKSR